jgi:hypothetical protein
MKTRLPQSHVTHRSRLISRCKRWHAIALAVAVALVATGCSSQQHTTDTAALAATVSVNPGQATSLRLPDGLQVSVPVGGVTRAGTLSATVIRAPAAAPRGMELAGPVYDLHLTGTTLRHAVRLVVPIPRPRQQGVLAGPNSALLVYYDSAAGRWEPIAASYSRAARTLTAFSPHLSIWSVLQLDAQQALAAATSALKSFFGFADAAQPTCPNSAKLAAMGVKVASDQGDLIRWCADYSNGGPLIRIANNRNYAIEADYPSNWSMGRVGSIGPVTRLILKLLPALSLKVSGPEFQTVIIPGNQQIDITPLTSASGVVLAGPSVEGIIVDALLYASDTLAMTYGDLPGAPQADPALTARAIAMVFQDGECLAQMTAVVQNPDVSTPQAAGAIFRDFTDVATSCLAMFWPAVYGIPGADAAIAVGTLLWLADGIKLILNDGQALIDSAVYWRDYHIYLESTSPKNPPPTPAPGSPRPSPSSSPTTAPSPPPTPPVPSAQCVLLEPNQTYCRSSDPTVILEAENIGDTSGCTFSDQISWGDGSPQQTVQFQGADNVPEVVASHTYQQLGGYGITDTVTVVSGDCTSTPGEYTFAYVTGGGGGVG